MYTTIIHPIRKALCLSVDEYVILDTVYQLSKNTKYAGWCVKTKEKIAEDLDYSRAKVYRTIDVLQQKGLIEKDEKTKYLRTADDYNEMIAHKDSYIIGFKGENSTFVSGKVTPSQNETDRLKMRLTPSQNETQEIYIKQKKEYTTYIPKKFVKLTLDEYQTLVERLGQRLADDYVERLENYVGSKGRKYKSHYHTILTWYRKDSEGVLPSPQSARPPSQRFKVLN